MKPKQKVELPVAPVAAPPAESSGASESVENSTLSVGRNFTAVPDIAEAISNVHEAG
jgi:hypothetical protein